MKSLTFKEVEERMKNTTATEIRMRQKEAFDMTEINTKINKLMDQFHKDVMGIVMKDIRPDL